MGPSITENVKSLVAEVCLTEEGKINVQQNFL